MRDEERPVEQRLEPNWVLNSDPAISHQWLLSLPNWPAEWLPSHHLELSSVISEHDQIIITLSGPSNQQKSTDDATQRCLEPPQTISFESILVAEIVA